MPSSSSFITVKRCAPLSRRCPATLQEQFVSSYTGFLLSDQPSFSSSKATTRSSKATTHIIHLISKRRPAARRPFVGSGPGKANLVSARPGAVCAPTVADQDTSRRNSYLQEPGRTLRWVATALSGLAAHTRSRRDLDSNPSRDRAEITSRRRPFQKGVIATLYARGHLRP